ncbi:ATP-binding cassette domain-containing protein [Spiroplasma clarkii]|uniref:ATP-binding cassette domain-containing protein n=1 Tax=Spiroplasma clarkii TaxID=2139 RepID=UPI00214FEDE8|nr:ABC transporter ATP-binding protein [Spiroplasma clarkii]
MSLTIKDGEVLGLLGSNGSGKTTLLDIIIGQQKPTSGTVSIDGKKDGYKNVGIQFQEGSWPKGVTAKLLIQYFRRKQKALTEEYVIKLIELFEIKDFLELDLNQLSGGQKQRLNTLLAVINDPKYICLDEMITGLDLKMQLKLIEWIGELKKHQKTIIIISHNPEEVEVLCDSFVIIERGHIYYEASVAKAIKEFGSIRNMMIKYYKEELKSNVISKSK